MINNIRYTTLNYYHSFLSTENVTLAILFHNLSTNERRFEITSNLGRICTFYDDLEVDLLKLILEGMRDTILNDSYFESIKATKPYDIYQFTRFYVNEFKFGKIIDIYDENFDQFVEETKKIYLKYDYEKSQRPDRNQEIKLFNKIMRSTSVKYNKLPIEGEFTEPITFDYIIENEYAIKLFDFKEKKLSQSVRNARNWSSIADELRGKFKVVFIYSVDKFSLDPEQLQCFESIIGILSKYSYKVLNIDDGSEFISSISSTSDQENLFSLSNF